MSTLKVTNLRHASASSDAITLDSDGTATAKITNRFGRNVLVNGAMRVCQRDTSKSGVTSSGYHTIDTYRFVDSSIGTWTVSQDSESPTQFSKSYKMACTTANASPGSSNSMRLECRLEGNQLQGFHKGTADAKPLALSFWTKTNEPGVYTVALYDHDNSRLVAANYTVSSGEASAQTWVKREVVFPADTTGAWDDDNAKSATLFFYFDVGSGFKSGTQNTSWGAASDAVTCPGMTAALGDSTSNVFYLTGIQLETDRVTDFEYRNYGDEIQRCLRYYYRTGEGQSLASNSPLAQGWARTANLAQLVADFPVPMRTSPSAIETTGTASDYDVSNVASGFSCDAVPTFDGASTTQAHIYMNVTGSMTVGGGARGVTDGTGKYIAFSAEL